MRNYLPECYYRTAFRKLVPNLCALFLLLCAIPSLGQAVNVTGTVRDQGANDPLPGVTVIVKGTTTGTVTDIDGSYSIQATPTSTLVFSFVGFERQEVEVGNQAIINISMEENITSLNEVVVVGYGTMERSNVTGSIVTVDVAEMQKTPIPNAVEALRGRVAGLQVSRGSGQPGSGVTFRIRGTNSLGGGR